MHIMVVCAMWGSQFWMMRQIAAGYVLHIRSKIVKIVTQIKSGRSLS